MSAVEKLRILVIHCLRTARAARRPLVTLLVPSLLILSGCASTRTAGASMHNCDLKEPPADSGEDGDHGIPMKIYPRRGAIGSTYSGCQTVWAHDGVTWSVAFVGVFENGTITRMRVPTEPGNPVEQCRMQSGRTVKGDKDVCTSMDILFPYSSVPPGCASGAPGDGGRDCAYD
jgi:uncharacterized protein YceK